MNKEKEIRKIFFTSIKCGTGGAYLLQKKYPNIDFSKEIIKAAVRNYAYDAQCENSRAKYIFRLLKKSKKRNAIESAILKRLRKEKKDFWSLVQLCKLTVLLHKSGNLDAKETLINRFEKNLYPDFEFCGQGEVMEIEGIGGVLRVANLIGKQLRADPNDYAERWILDRYQKRNPHIDTYAILKENAKKNRNIKAYYKSLLKHPEKKYKRKPTSKYTYELIKERLENGRLRFISKVRANELSEAESKRLADDFLRERDIDKKKSYLYFFRSRKFPYDFNSILDLLNLEKSSNSNLKSLVISALQLFESKKLRKLAIKKFKKNEEVEIFIPLLIKNYKKGDDKYLLEVLKLSKKQEFIHSVACELISIYKSNKTKDCKSILEQVYYTMRCSIHREDVLELLAKNNVLKKRILNEMKYDCRPKIRHMYRKLIC